MPYDHHELFPLGHDDETPYRKLTSDHVSTLSAAGRSFLQVEPAALTWLAREAMRDIAHLLRPAHLARAQQVDHPLQLVALAVDGVLDRP